MAIKPRRTKEKPNFRLIRKELDLRLSEEISAYKNIDWFINSKKYRDKTQPRYELCLLIINTIRNQAKTHKSDDKYVSFSSVDLRKKLGFDYVKIMDTAFIKKSVGGGYEMKKDKVTLKYKLKDIVIDICNDVYSDKKIMSRHIGRGGIDITTDTLPNYTITGTSQGLEIYEYKKEEQIDSVVQLNDINIRILFSVYADLYKKYIEDKDVKVNDGEKLLKEFGWDINDIRNKDRLRFHNTIIDRFDKVKALLDETHDDSIGVGRIVQLYKQVDSGRYYMHNDINLQTIPREMRKIAMGGLGYYEYDIENCHYVILNQLNKMYGGETLTYVNKYIKDTKTFRTTIAKELGLTIELAKKLMLIIVYGGGLSVKHRYDKSSGESVKSAIIQDLTIYTDGDEDLIDKISNDIQSNKLLMGLYADVKKARDLLLKDKEYYMTYRGDKYFKNHFKRRTLLHKNGSKKNKGSLLSHLLQGVESTILDIVMLEDDSVVMFHHDGWVSKSNMDVRVLSEVINNKLQFHFEKLGYKGLMKISVTKEELSDINKTPALDSRLKRKVVLDRK